MGDHTAFREPSRFYRGLLWGVVFVTAAAVVLFYILLLAGVL